MEKPIMFSTPMVIAILEGRKSQTRRMMKPQPEPDLEKHANSHYWISGLSADSYERVHIPRYGLGAILWVRETWATIYDYDNLKPSELPHDAPICYKTSKFPYLGKTRPSIFMPKWVSRITLKVTEVRVQRLQDISVSDIRAEGFDPCGSWTENNFRLYWDKLNGKKHPWSSNPYVFAYTFERVR